MNKDGGIRSVARRLRVSKQVIAPDLVQQGGSDSYWSVQETQEIVPIAAFKSAGSAIAYCLRAMGGVAKVITRGF